MPERLIRLLVHPSIWCGDEKNVSLDLAPLILDARPRNWQTVAFHEGILSMKD